MIITGDLKVVDVNLALELISGYEQIYQKLILAFQENQSNLIEDIKKHLDNDLNEARRLVHSCKGISKNIGSLPLYEVTSALESAIINRDSELINIYFVKFQVIFEQVLVDLNNIQF
jgi:HPt (histidine-containing phosphotransfer) domain-containing protein